MTALKTENYFSLLLPESLGGRQLGFTDYIQRVQAVATADGSTGWCVNQGSVLASLARLLPADVASEIWHRPDIVVANGPPANCQSIPGGHGYCLSGSWSFSSGINHADWLIGMAPVKAAGVTKGFLWHFFPKSSATIEEKWPVKGLKATGSFQFSVDNLNILKTHAIAIEVQQDDPPIYQIPMNLLFAAGFAAVALGVSRAALDFAEERLKQKVKRFDKQTMNQDLLTQDAIARAEASWQSADAYLHHNVESTWQSVNALGHCTFDHKVKLRLAATHVIRQSKVVTDAAYDLCSTDSIYEGADIQRRFQDMHVISQHLQGRPEIYHIVGKHYLGLDAQSHLIG